MNNNERKKNGVNQLYHNLIKKNEIIQKYFMFNGKKEGEYKEYHSCGDLIICNYRNGKKEGEYKYYHVSSESYYVCDYKNNKRSVYRYVKL